MAVAVAVVLVCLGKVRTARAATFPVNAEFMVRAEVLVHPRLQLVQVIPEVCAAVAVAVAISTPQVGVLGVLAGFVLSGPVTLVASHRPTSALNF
jgi:hypothetical protein